MPTVERQVDRRQPSIRHAKIYTQRLDAEAVRESSTKRGGVTGVFPNPLQPNCLLDHRLTLLQPVDSFRE